MKRLSILFSDSQMLAIDAVASQHRCTRATAVRTLIDAAIVHRTLRGATIGKAKAPKTAKVRA